MNVERVDSIVLPSPNAAANAGDGTRSFGAVLAAAIDGTAAALDRADARAGAMAVGSGGIMEASVARAKADVALEIASVAASRVSGALNGLMQTQV